MTNRAGWLMKSEPDAYGWDQLVADGQGVWDGVRNHLAARHLRAMAVGDLAYFYHSVTGKAVVGIMTITATAVPDPTVDRVAQPGAPWVAVRVAPRAPLGRPVTLSAIKAEPALADLMLLRQSRLSVVPVAAPHWAIIAAMGGIDDPALAIL